jgi:alpha-tubulin suppressor-like RCC1 family protein
MMMRVLLTFGINEDGQCGFENSDDRLHNKVATPVVFPSKVIISFVSAGSRHTLALANNGFVYSWGWGKLGQLGHGVEENCHTPTLIQKNFSCIISISAGGMHSGCLDSNYKCYMWGSAKYGQLGLGRIDNNVSKPTLVTLPSTGSDFLVSRLSCGGMHTAVVDVNGSVYSWGRADSGQTGFSDWYLDFSPGLFSPKLVVGFDGKAIDVACGGFHTLILTDQGCVYAMGKEDFGLLGIGSLKEWRMKIGAESPTLITSLINYKIISISAGGWHSCFVTSEGELFTCGKGEYGRLGLKDEKSKPLPCIVDNYSTFSTQVKEVSAGGSHTIWTTFEGDVYTVGRVDGGRLGVGNDVTTDRFTTPQCITSTLLKNIDICATSPQNYDLNIIQASAGGAHSALLVDIFDHTGDDHSLTKKVKYI